MTKFGFYFIKSIIQRKIVPLAVIILFNKTQFLKKSNFCTKE